MLNVQCSMFSSVPFNSASNRPSDPRNPRHHPPAAIPGIDLPQQTREDRHERMKTRAPHFLATLAILASCLAPQIACAAPGTLALSRDPGSNRTTLSDLRAGITWDLGVMPETSISQDRDQIVVRGTATGNETLRLIDHALGIHPGENGFALTPTREGLLIPADGPLEFNRTFTASGYEGCHMNMIGLLKRGAALLVTWTDAYVRVELAKTKQGLQCSVLARKPPHAKDATFTLNLIPLGPGDWNTIAAAYRAKADSSGLAVTLATKEKRNPELSKLVGASNAKLWTCLARRRNEQSTQDEKVDVKWTFDEAAQIAEHLSRDLAIDRCLFILGGWTEGGYDCRHPDALPANPECGGDGALANSVKRIRSLGYVACFHDNYQDMYRDAKSWDPGCIQKKPDGTLMTGGRWLGGRAYLVCAPKTLELARRPLNLPEIQRRFSPQAYFIDTTFAVDPQECFDPNHPLDRNSDIAAKQQLSDYTRDVFGIFGSECGREWAIPHSDFFEGLIGVSGKYFHNLDPATLGATVVPLFEMVYHDCEFVYGKYGYAPEQAAEYVAHHVLCARTLNYHKFDSHLYWKATPTTQPQPNTTPGDPACFTRGDHGWTDGLCTMDRFLKNTHEILGPLAATTAHSRLTRLEFLNPERTARRATFDCGTQPPTVVTVNFGPDPFVAHSAAGGDVKLPRWGFLIESPDFTAFHALTWAGATYNTPTLFTIRSDERHTRIFHGFGDERLIWKNRTLTVQRSTEE